MVRTSVWPLAGVVVALGLAGCAASPLYVPSPHRGTVGEIPRDGNGEPMWESIPRPQAGPPAPYIPVAPGIPITGPGLSEMRVAPPAPAYAPAAPCSDHRAWRFRDARSAAGVCPACLFGTGCGLRGARSPRRTRRSDAAALPGLATLVLHAVAVVARCFAVRGPQAGARPAPRLRPSADLRIARLNIGVDVPFGLRTRVG